MPARLRRLYQHVAALAVLTVGVTAFLLLHSAPARAFLCSAPGGTAVGAAGYAVEVGPGNSVAVCAPDWPWETRVYTSSPGPSATRVGYTQCSTTGTNYCTGSHETVYVGSVSSTGASAGYTTCDTTWQGIDYCNGGNLVALGNGSSAQGGTAVANGGDANGSGGCYTCPYGTAFSIGGSAYAERLALATTGNAGSGSPTSAAASGTGSAGSPLLAVSGTGYAYRAPDHYGYAGGRSIGISGAGNANAPVAVSGTGTAYSPPTPYRSPSSFVPDVWLFAWGPTAAVAGGNASAPGGLIAVSGTGDATGGQVNVAPLGHAG